MAQIDPSAFGYYQDAIRFGQIDGVGSPRTLGMGGITTAIGADASSVAGNPAGLGMYNRSEYSLSFWGESSNTQAQYESSGQVAGTTGDNRFGLGLQHFSFVAHKASDVPGSPWKGRTWSFSYQRTQNFNRRTSYEGTNFSSSRRDAFVQQAEGTPWQDLDNQVGAFTDPLAVAYFIDIIDNRGTPSSYFTYEAGLPVRQQEIITESGGQNLFSMAWAGNYQDRLFLGGGVSVATLRYNRTSEYQEDISGADTLQRFDLDEEINTTGLGIQAQVGLLWRPATWLMLGGRVQTPTLFALNEQYTARLSAEFRGSTFNFFVEDATIPSDFDYTLRTPWRFSVGATGFVGKYGLVSAEVETVDYSQLKLNSSLADFSGDNRTIEALYGRTTIVRLGTEVRAKRYYFRLGYQYEDSPFQEVAGLRSVDRSRRRVTGGGGYRDGKFFMDLSVWREWIGAGYAPYSVADASQPAILSDIQRWNFSLGGGVLF